MGTRTKDVGTSAGAAGLGVDGVTLTRGAHAILSRVDLSVRAGEVHGLLGLNGPGKSTLAYALMGCDGYAPDEGTMRFAGRDLTGLSITERARLGITLAWQEPTRFEGLTASAYPAGTTLAPPSTRRCAFLPVSTCRGPEAPRRLMFASNVFVPVAAPPGEEEVRGSQGPGTTRR